MHDVIVYSSAHCPYCERAKQLLTQENIPFQVVGVDTNPSERTIMERRSQRRTVPQIFIGERHVGGYDDLYALHQSGELRAWLASE